MNSGSYHRTFNEKGRCGFSCAFCCGIDDLSLTFVGVSPADPEDNGVGGPCSTGLSPPDVDEEGDFTLPCNQPNTTVRLVTYSHSPFHYHHHPSTFTCVFVSVCLSRGKDRSFIIIFFP